MLDIAKLIVIYIIGQFVGNNFTRNFKNNWSAYSCQHPMDHLTCVPGLPTSPYIFKVIGENSLGKKEAKDIF